MKARLVPVAARRNYRGPRKGDQIFWRWGDWKRQRLTLLDYPRDTAISRLILYHCRLGGNFHTNYTPTYRIDHKAEDLDHKIQELEDKYQAILLVYYNAVDISFHEALKALRIGKTTFYDRLDYAMKLLA